MGNKHDFWSGCLLLAMSPWSWFLVTTVPSYHAWSFIFLLGCIQLIVLVEKMLIISDYHLSLRLLVAGCWLSLLLAMLVDCWLIVDHCWLLIVASLLLAIMFGYWLLLVDCWFIASFDHLWGADVGESLDAADLLRSQLYKPSQCLLAGCARFQRRCPGTSAAAMVRPRLVP